MRTRIAIAVSLSCLLIVLSTAAADRGRLSGSVIDHSGRPLTGATVRIVGPEHRISYTDARGEFVFAAVLPGVYSIHVELTGFLTATDSATVRASLTERRTFRLTADTAARSQAQETVRRQTTSLPRSAEAAVMAAPMAAPVGMAAPGSQAFHDRSWRHAGPFNTEAYDHLDENPFRRVTVDPLSTFSIDVDTASYANVRRFLHRGAMPPAGAVRVEELINYFRFAYPQPSGDAPFSVTTEVSECPWNPKHRLALIGLQGREIDEQSLPPRNLVFLIDVSGSMDSPDKLPLVRHGLRMLVDTLTDRDRVAIVVYAGSSGGVLPSTPGDHKARIHQAIAGLEAGGSTNGGQGIGLAYRIAREQFNPGGVNRVVLATDGDFNVGVTSQDALVRLIEEQRASGVFLSVLGVGTGNLKDSTMEKLADRGNGNYAYLDSLHEARKVLVREAGATLVTIAKDIKLQVEFNPQTVEGYRLIGYENRLLRHEDFNDDRKDAGEIGAGHSVTALYEIVPKGVPLEAPGIDPLKYQQAGTTNTTASDDLLTVKLRFKAPDGDVSRLISTSLSRQPQSLTPNLGFASAVAEVAMLLRHSKHAPAASYASAIARARTFRQSDPEGYRAEFITLAEVAAGLSKMDNSVRK